MKKITLFAFIIASQFTFAQRNLTIEEATSGSYTTFAPENMVAPQWKDAKNLTYLDKTYQNLMSRNASNNWSESILISKSDLIDALNGSIKDEQFKLRIFPYDYQWKDSNTLVFNASGAESNYVITYDIPSKKVVSYFKMDGSGLNQVVSEKGDVMAWLKDNNIYITDVTGKVTQITNDAAGFLNGSDYTHRQEFGIDRGMWWNPTANQLAFYKKNETMVTDYPLVQFDTRIAEVKNTKYPMAGMKSEEVTLNVYDVNTGKTITIQTGEPKEQYLTQITWDPSGKYIYIGVLNRDQNHLKLNKYDASNGKFVSTLFEEKSTKWVEPQNPLTFLPNGKQFLYQSQKDGYNQLYLYDTNGKLIKKLGYNNVVVKDLLDFDTKGNSVSYIGVTNNGLDRQLFTVDLKSGKTTQVTTGSGFHNAKFNDDKTFFYDQFSNIETPNKIAIVDSKSKKETTLVDSKNPYQGVAELPTMEMVKIKAADGKTDLNGRIIYPANFDPNKKYPVMVYVYGGPHAQLVQNKWLGGASLFDYYMAQQGFVVFTLDNRGSDARDRDFVQVIHRNLGQNEMADQMKGVEFLKSKSFVDADKIGVYGWSYGGFMTTSLMLNYPETFKVGVAGGPVIDWKWYEIMYGERYMDTPQDNPEGYALTNTLNKVNNLEGRLLMIHGAQDPVVVQQHSMEFIEACIKAGKQVDYFLYPTHEHNVSGKDRIHLNAKIADYFKLHLQ
ncbi:S9 family peptidase [Paenimyroides tangerinum]|uniref:S9 family peptidase n=1 Tax=Paenimyroides tangerinum TaxID=2488728 RepID=A0A3P3W7T2_9FLAO|nr:S9 family peptidase [Paenimyroides tangerinum]RRJ91221.1 S9 family peptidase [Paenimyroides tangerinum]